MQNRLAWSCEVCKRTVRHDGMDLWPGNAHFLAGQYRRLRDIHTFIMDEVFTKMRKDNIAQWA